MGLALESQMQFVMLTSVKDNQHVWINLTLVRAFHPVDDGTMLTLGDAHAIAVKETPQQVTQADFAR